MHHANRTALSLSALALAGVAGGVLTSLLAAGPLNPPAGPVTSTYKTLTEVEPRIAINAANTPGAGASIYKITQPGSYYLTANVTGGAGRHGIEIAASGVTLDLMGFDLVGVPGSLDGVTVTVAGVNIAVVNGSVRSWGGDGVDLATAIPINTRVEQVHASGNTGTGILTSSGSTVSNCSASFNVASGIHTGNGGAVTNSSATGNGVIGISTLGGCTVTNCAGYKNSGNGIQVGVGCTVADSSSFDSGGQGISTGSRCTVSGCSSSANTGTGIDTSFDCVITECLASGNSGGGIATDVRCSIANCAASGNTGNGISTLAGSTLTNCSADSNTGNGFNTLSTSTISNCSAYSNQGDGINTSQGNVVTNCSVSNSAGYGIRVSTGSTVSGCSIKFITLDAIRCDAECVIRNNNTGYAGWVAGDGAGIHATGAYNHIEGNHCSRGDRGIDVDSSASTIIGNTCAGNSLNWSIAANNYYGAIVNRTGVATAVVSGDFAPTALASTDPHANFTY